MTTLDVTAIVSRMGAPVRMVPRRILLERLLEGFPAERIRCNTQVVGVEDGGRGIRLDFADGRCAAGDLVIGADGLHSTVREIVGAAACRADGLVQLARTGQASGRGRSPRRLRHRRRAREPRPVAGRRHRGAVVVRSAVVAGLCQARTPDRRDPRQLHRMVRAGRSSTRHIDRRRPGAFALSAFPASRSGAGPRRADIAGRCGAHDAADAGAGNQPGTARHDGAVQGDLGCPPRPRRRPVRCAALVREDPPTPCRGGVPVASLQVSHGECVLRPAAMVPDRVMTWVLATFLRAGEPPPDGRGDQSGPRRGDDGRQGRTCPLRPCGCGARSTRRRAGCGSSNGACWPCRTTRS